MELGRGVGSGVRTLYFLKTVTCLGCAGFCRKYFPPVYRVDAAAWFNAALFSVPSRRQPCMSPGAGSRAPAAARSGASPAQRDRGRRPSAPAPRQRGQVKHCQVTLRSPGWGRGLLE